LQFSAQGVQGACAPAVSLRQGGNIEQKTAGIQYWNTERRRIEFAQFLSSQFTRKHYQRA
jgi:hypothetical protein